MPKCMIDSSARLGWHFFRARSLIADKSTRPRSPLRSTRLCRVVAALLLLATPAAAQPPEPNEEEAIEVVVHAPRQTHDDVQDGTRPANVTSGEQVREAGGVQSVADALRNQPGTSVQQTTPGQGTVYVRGLSGRAVIHVVDGVRVNSALFRAGNNPYTSLVDLCDWARRADPAQ